MMLFLNNLQLENEVKIWENRSFLKTSISLQVAAAAAAGLFDVFLGTCSQFEKMILCLETELPESHISKAGH